MRVLATIISVLFHPMLMATYGCLLIFFGIENTVYNYLTSLGTKWKISVIVFIFSFIFPALTIYILYKLKHLPSITLSEQRHRSFPYLMTSLYYFGLCYMLLDINIWPSIKVFIAGGGAAIMLTALINLRYKISAHMVGMGGLLGVLISISYLIRFDMTIYYIILIVLAGIVGFARLALGEHKPSQIYTGFLLGVLVQTGLFFALQKLIFA